MTFSEHKQKISHITEAVLLAGCLQVFVQKANMAATSSVTDDVIHPLSDDIPALIISSTSRRLLAMIVHE